MQTAVTTIWNNPQPQQLVEALLGINDKQTMQNFLRDVMTEKEIIEISARFEAARLLVAGETYAIIIERTKLSSRTVARISDWLKNGCTGYQAALSSLGHHSHTLPARVE